MGEDGKPTPSGEMIVCAIDLAYLTMQCQGEILRPQEQHLLPADIMFKPRKTESTTGAAVLVPRTPEINAMLEAARRAWKGKDDDKQRASIASVYIIHTSDGQPYTKSGIETAWARARTRGRNAYIKACDEKGVSPSASFLVDMHFHDLRARAQTDAKRLGYSLEQIQAGATHSRVTTTEGYIKRLAPDRSEIKLPAIGKKTA